MSPTTSPVRQRSTLCEDHAFPSGAFGRDGTCQPFKQTSGDPTDSTWEATFVVPEGATSGTWNFEVSISDAAGNLGNDLWFGPDRLAAMGPTIEPTYHAIPDDGGVFTVQGTPQDLNAPALTSLALSPCTVDTSTGAAQVTADIAGTDVEGITGADLYIAGWVGYPDHPGVESAKVTGTYVDPALSKVTVGDWAQRWLDGQAHLKPTTRSRYTGIVSKHIRPEWDRVTLANVSHADVQAWVTELASSHSPRAWPRSTECSA